MRTATVVPESKRGRKHRCAACGAAYYDLGRKITVCPKCEKPYDSPAQMPTGEARRRKTRSSSRPPNPEPTAGEAPEPDEEKHAVAILDEPADRDDDDGEDLAVEGEDETAAGEKGAP